MATFLTVAPSLALELTDMGAVMSQEWIVIPAHPGLVVLGGLVHHLGQHHRAPRQGHWVPVGAQMCCA